MKKLTLIFTLFLILIPVALAADFTPTGNINGRNIYRIYNFTNICFGNSCIQNWSNITLASGVYYADDNWLYLSGITFNFNETKLSNLYYNKTYTSSVFSNLQSNITNVDSRVTGLNSSVNTIAVNLQTNITNVDARATGLNSSLNTIAGNLQTNITTVDARVTGLNSSMNNIAVNLQTNITNVDVRVTSLNNSKLNASDQRYNDTAFATAYADSLLITTYYNVSSINVVTGTPAGVIGDLRVYDGISYNVSEVNADVAFYLNFTGIQGFNQIVIRYASINGENHQLTLSIWDYTDGAWETYAVLGETSGSFVVDTIGVFDSSTHNSSGIVQMRLTTTNLGAATDTWKFDWISISKGAATPSGMETDPFSIHKDGTTQLTDNWNATFNITFGNGNGIPWYNVLGSTWINTSNLTSLGYNTTTQLDTKYLSKLTATTCGTGNYSRLNSSYGFECFSDQTGASTDMNNYTSSIAFAGAILTLGRTGMTSLTATIPNNAITLDATNISAGTLAVARLPTLNNQHTHAVANLTDKNNLVSTHTHPFNNITTGTATGDFAITGALNISKNLTMTQANKICGNANCSAWMCFNGTGWIINSGNVTVTC